MFFEVILSQCLSSLLNFQFMMTVKDAIADDEERAGWTGGVSDGDSGNDNADVCDTVHACRTRKMCLPSFCPDNCMLSQLYSATRGSTVSAELCSSSFFQLSQREYTARIYGL